MKRFIALAAGLTLAACGTNEKATSSSAAAQQSAAQQSTPESTAAAQTPAAADPKAPDSYRVAFVTSRGPFTVQVTRALAPLGADRFYHLVSIGYFTNVRFFRVVPGFVAQFGMAPDPKVNALWAPRAIPDDPVKTTNAKGTLVFATSGPNSRSNQLFINLVDNSSLDAQGFAPFGRVVKGMNVIDSIYSGYGERPNQDEIAAKGNAYLEQQFPKLDYIKSAEIVDSAGLARRSSLDR